MISLNGFSKLFLYLMIHLISTSSQSGSSRLNEYCFDESFEAECGPDEVIVMQSALYGRMELGRCITKRVDECRTKDVLSIMDKKCSGRRLCDMQVTDKELLASNPCPKDFTAYLLADYHCQPVQEKCTTFRHEAITLSPTSGYISSFYSSPSCLYKLEVARGQKITILLKDFEPYKNVSEKEGSPTICQQILEITEPLVDTRDTVCRNSERHRTEYTSQTHSIEMSLKNTNTAYLIGYRVIGCPSLEVPRGAHIVKETHEEAIIKCNHTKLTAKMECRDGRWVGKKLMCIVPAWDNNKNTGNHEKHEDTIGLPSLGISLLIIFGVAVVIVLYVAGMMVCVMYFKKKRRNKDRPVKSLHAEGQDDVMLPYDKIFTNPHEEHLPMLLKSGTLRHAPMTQPQQHQHQQCECNETHCQIHGPITSCESPYIVAGPNYKLCQCETHTTNTAKGQTTTTAGTFPNCCIPANSMPSSIDRGSEEHQNNITNSTYQSSRSLKGVRFATLNGREPKPFYLELNSRGLGNVVRDSCPDVLPTESSDKIEETQLSTFR